MRSPLLDIGFLWTVSGRIQHAVVTEPKILGLLLGALHFRWYLLVIYPLLFLPFRWDILPLKFKWHGISPGDWVFMVTDLALTW